MRKRHVHGPPGGPKAFRPTAVFLHGFMGSVDDWAYFLERVPNSTALSLPGHAGTAPPMSFSHAVEELYEHMRLFEAVHLVGYSMGGRLALAAALQLEDRRPGVVRTLTIISSTPGLRTAVEREARAREDDRRADALALQGLEQFVHRWYSLPLFASLQRRPALLRALIVRRAQGGAAAMAAALRALTVGRQPPLWDALSHLKCPVLWLAGEWDAAYRETARRAASLSPRGYARIVPVAGHMPHLERPEFTIEQIAELWEKNEYAG